MDLRSVQLLRRKPDIAVLEGFHALKHCLRFGGEVIGCWTADLEALAALRDRLAPDVVLPPGLQVVDADALAQVVPRAQVVALARRPAGPTVDELLARPGPEPVVLLEAPRHLGNLGAAVRVSAAAGAAGLLSTGTADPWHPDAIRGAAGLQFALPVRRVTGAPESLELHGRPLVALDPDGEPLGPGRATLPPRAVLAFGTERDGLTDALLARCDARVALPMRPGVSSMNLATAVSATLFAALLAG